MKRRVNAHLHVHLLVKKVFFITAAAAAAEFRVLTEQLRNYYISVYLYFYLRAITSSPIHNIAQVPTARWCEYEYRVQSTGPPTPTCTFHLLPQFTGTARPFKQKGQTFITSSRDCEEGAGESLILPFGERVFCVETVASRRTGVQASSISVSAERRFRGGEAHGQYLLNRWLWIHVDRDDHRRRHRCSCYRNPINAKATKWPVCTEDSPSLFHLHSFSSPLIQPPSGRERVEKREQEMNPGTNFAGRRFDRWNVNHQLQFPD
ncbi:hypothetical protein KQX54_016581 [Cotesia glomerata]|uniref:Secreted protein n=1 Tax=Cotesia glomerata TaxID=32391 RepID=A0AAV7HZG3_COTGL|nr:hypothetical protein KQX54_016581 [Cotesia glomerata]